MHISTILFLIA